MKKDLVLGRPVNGKEVGEWEKEVNEGERHHLLVH